MVYFVCVPVCAWWVCGGYVCVLCGSGVSVRVVWPMIGHRGTLPVIEPIQLLKSVTEDAS